MKNLRPFNPAAVLTECDLVPVGDGSYRAIPHRPRSKLTVRDAARLANCSLTTIYRLLRAGFITSERPSPRKILIDADSLQAHIVALRDPDFWTPERRARFWDT